MPFFVEFPLWYVARAASAFLAEQGVRHALGGSSALAAHGFDTVAPDVDFLVERVPLIPPWLMTGESPSGDQIREEMRDDTHGECVMVLGQKVDFIPVGRKYDDGAHLDEERAWLERAVGFHGSVPWHPLGGAAWRGQERAIVVPTLAFPDALRWKWLAGRDKDLSFLAAANYGRVRKWTPEELAILREYSDAALAAMRMQKMPEPSMNRAARKFRLFTADYI